MSLEKLAVLLPCHSLEDLSLNRPPHEADELLSAWSGLFQPALLALVGSLPTWSRADAPPSDPAGHLVVLPECCEAEVPADWLQKAADAGAVVVRNCRRRDQLVAKVLETLRLEASGVDPQLTADFLALGFCHLQVELLTRQLRYMSNLDEARFQEETIAAAEDAVKGQAQTAREHLRSAFDLLTEAREYFYPVETYLLDLTLVAATTLGESLRAELARREMTNLLISGEVVDVMARREPATLSALKEALEKSSATIIGGEFDEQELPLLPVEAILARLKRGLASYAKHLDRRPKIFGRRRFGLSPLLPQILRKLGFTGVLHFTLDDGRFPKSNQSKIRWEGVDSTVIDATVRLPIDASRPDCFLNLPEKLGDTMDLDHAATAVFAHWPGRESPWYEDIRRMGEYSSVLGRFTSVTDYFRDTEYVGQSSKYAADQYRSPYLRQAVAQRQADPISRWVRYHRRHAAAEALRTLAGLTDLIAGRGIETAKIEALLRDVEDTTATGAGDRSQLDDHLRHRLDEAVKRFAKCLPREKKTPQKGYLVANPWSFARQVCLDVSGLRQLPAVGKAVPTARESAARKPAVADVPAMGFVWIGGGSQAPPSPEREKRKKSRWRKAKKEELPLAEENVLRNEHFEVKIDPTTGAIRSVYDYTTRSNRLAQQIALRFPRSGSAGEDGRSEDDSRLEYSVMAADEISVTSPGPILGRIVTRGRLLDVHGKRMAGFVQTLEAHRGSPILQLKIDLDIDRQPGPNPWNSYYAARFAWGDATADVVRSVGSTSQPSDIPQVEAPHFVDIRTGKTRTTILTGGLPYHRRFGLRKLDTLLVVQGETARSFRLGIGVNLVHPMPAALGFLAPETPLSETASPPPGHTGWLFHVDSKNVLATRWEPLTSDDRVTGYRVRLLETEGRRSRVGLRSFRPVQSAQKVDFLGQQPEELPAEGDRVQIDLGAHEWVQVEAEFAT